jgi:hypothetical protein
MKELLGMTRIRGASKQQLTVCIAPQNAQLVWAKAKEEKKTTSEIIDLAISKYFEEREKEEPSGIS